MEPTYEFRKKYTALGEQRGYRAGLARAVELLDHHLTAGDVEMAIEGFRAALAGELDATSEHAHEGAAGQSPSARKTENNGAPVDLVDRVADAMGL